MRVSAPIEKREKVADWDIHAVMVDLFIPFPKDEPIKTPMGDDSQHLE